MNPDVVRVTLTLDEAKVLAELALHHVAWCGTKGVAGARKLERAVRRREPKYQAGAGSNLFL